MINNQEKKNLYSKDVSRDVQYIQKYFGTIFVKWNFTHIDRHKDPQIRTHEHEHNTHKYTNTCTQIARKH